MFLTSPLIEQAIACPIRPIPKMNELFAFAGAKQVSLRNCGLSFDDSLQRLENAEAGQAEEERSAFLLSSVHDTLR